MEVIALTTLFLAIVMGVLMTRLILEGFLGLIKGIIETLLGVAIVKSWFGF